MPKPGSEKLLESGGCCGSVIYIHQRISNLWAEDTGSGPGWHALGSCSIIMSGVTLDGELKVPGPQFSLLNGESSHACLIELLRKFKNRGAWVAQRLSVCLQLRACSRRYGIEPHIRLLRYEPASSSPPPPACVLSLSNK